MGRPMGAGTALRPGAYRQSEQLFAEVLSAHFFIAGLRDVEYEDTLHGLLYLVIWPDCCPDMAASSASRFLVTG